MSNLVISLPSSSFFFLFTFYFLVAFYSRLSLLSSWFCTMRGGFSFKGPQEQVFSSSSRKDHLLAQAFLPSLMLEVSFLVKPQVG